MAFCGKLLSLFDCHSFGAFGAAAFLRYQPQFDRRSSRLWPPRLSLSGDIIFKALGNPTGLIANIFW